jgi:curved DNA-binding protein CbpA
MPTHYEILGLKESASEEEIVCMYRRLAKQYHPDMKSGNAEQFKKISESYQVLADNRLRSKYNFELQNSNKSKKKDLISTILRECIYSALSGVLFVYAGVFALVGTTIAEKYIIIFLTFTFFSAALGFWFLKKIRIT